MNASHIQSTLVLAIPDDFKKLLGIRLSWLRYRRYFRAFQKCAHQWDLPVIHWKYLRSYAVVSPIVSEKCLENDTYSLRGDTLFNASSNLQC